MDLLRLLLIETLENQTKPSEQDKLFIIFILCLHLSPSQSPPVIVSRFRDLCLTAKIKRFLFCSVPKKTVCKNFSHGIIVENYCPALCNQMPLHDHIHKILNDSNFCIRKYKNRKYKNRKKSKKKNRQRKGCYQTNWCRAIKKLSC